MVRDVEQVKKSENDNFFQCQNITKAMKIGDFTVKTQVNNCMHAWSAGPVAGQLADYPT